MNEQRVSIKVGKPQSDGFESDFADYDLVRSFAIEQLLKVSQLTMQIANAKAAVVCWVSSNGVRFMAQHGLGNLVYSQTMVRDLRLFAPIEVTTVSGSEQLKIIQDFLGVKELHSVLAIPISSHRGNHLGSLMLLYQEEFDVSQVQINYLQQILSLVMSGIEVTRLERIERSQSASSLAEVVTQAKECVIHFDRELKIIAWNLGARETYGYARHEIHSLQQLIPPEEQASFQRGLSQLEQNQALSPKEVIRLHQSGFRIQVRSSLSVVRDQNQRVTGFVEFSGIPSDPKRSAAIERLHEVIQVLPLMFWQTDIRGRFVFAEGQILEALNHQHQVLIGSKANDFFADQPIVLQAIEQALRGTRIHQTIVWHERTFEFWFEPILQQSKLSGINVLMLDVTVRTQALNEQRLTLEHLVQTQSRLAQQQVFAEMILSTIEQGVTVHSLDGSFEYVSPRYAQMLGYEADHLIGKKAIDFIPPEDLSALESSRQDLLAGWQQQFVHRAVRADGSIAQLEATAYPRLNANQQQNGVIALVRDISFEREFEQEFREIKQKLEKETEFALKVTNTMSQGLVTVDHQAQVIFANPQTARLAGVSDVKDLIGMNLISLVPEHQQALVRHEWQQIRLGQETTYRHEVARADGQKIEVEIMVYPELDEAKRFASAVIIITDITEALALERAAFYARKALERESQNTLLIANAMNDGLAIINQASCYEYVNPAWAKMLGYSAHQDLIGESSKTDVLESAIPTLQAADQQLEAGEICEYTYQLKCFDGRLLTVHNTSYPRFEAGRYKGFIVIMRDITALEAMKRQQEIAARIAQTVNQGLAVIGPLGTFEFVNSAFATMLERSPEQLLGLTLLEILAPKELQRADANWQNRVYLVPNTFFSHLVNAAGQEFPVEISYYPQIKDNQFDGAVLVISNLSDQIARELEVMRVSNTILEHEQAMRLQDQKLNLVMESIDQGVTVFGADKKLEYYNPAYARILGYDPEDTIEYDLRLIHPDDIPVLMEVHSKRDQQQSSSYTLRMIRKDGSIVEVEVMGYPRVVDGEFYGSVALVNDISKRTQRERELMQKHRRLELIDQIRNRTAKAKNNQELMHLIVESIHQVLSFPMVGLLLLEQDQLIMQHAIGYDHQDYRFPMSGSGVMVRSALHQQVMIVTDAQQEPDFIYFSPDIRSELCVPIIAGDQVLGVINLEDTRVNAFDQTDAMLLQAIADRIADRMELTKTLDGLRLLEWTKQEADLQSDQALNHQTLYLPDLEAALQFMRGVGGESYFVASYEAPVNTKHSKLMLRGRGFVLVVARGELADLPTSMVVQSAV